MAQRLNIPVIFFNREPNPLLLQEAAAAYYVGSFGAQSGLMQAQILSDYLKSHPQADRDEDNLVGTVMIKGQQNHQDTALRAAAALQHLQSEGFNNR